jgi:hypothetical protein
LTERPASGLDGFLGFSMTVWPGQSAEANRTIPQETETHEKSFRMAFSSALACPGLLPSL